MRSSYFFKEHTGGAHSGSYYYSWDEKWLYIEFDLEGWHCFNRYYVNATIGKEKDKYLCEILPFLFNSNRYAIKGINLRRYVYG